MRTIERDIVSAVVYSGDGKIFMAMGNRATGTAYAGTWKIPGGGIDDGETAMQALEREMLEETGIDIRPYPIKLVVDDMTGEAEKTLRETGERVLAKMKFSTYTIQLDKPADEVHIRLDPHEFEEFKWIDPQELKDYELNTASVELFTRLGYLN